MKNILYIIILLIPVYTYSQTVTNDSTNKEPTISINQQSLETINKLVAKIEAYEEEDKIFQFGLGVGYRTLITNEKELYVNATISTKDSTLKLQKRHRQDLVLSGVLMTFPFNDSSNVFGINISDLGFVANINLAKINEESITLNNSVIEGGIGICYKIHDKFSFSMTWEKMFARKTWEYVKPDEKLISGNEVVTTIDTSDDRYFRDSVFTAYSFMFVYSF